MRKRNVGVLLLAVLLVIATSGTAALADTDSPLWEEGDVLDSDEATTNVDELQQEASVTLEGPPDLDVDHVGTYTVEVTNDAPERVLDEWALGLSVDSIEQLDDLTIAKGEDESDLTDGESGFEVELDQEADIIYLRDDDTSEIESGESETLEFQIAFHTDGEFTGTAYVIEDEQPTGAISGEVTDDRDDGVGAATVEAFEADATEASSTTTTEEDGTYELSGLEDGEYDVTVDAGGFEEATDQATVTDGGTTTLDFTLELQN